MAITLTAVSPATAQYVGGAMVTLTGTGLLGVYEVSVGGIIADSWRYSAMDDTSATLVIPPLATVVDGAIVPILGAVDIVVTSDDGSATLTGALAIYQEQRTLFLDGFDYYSTAELPYKWRNPVNLHVAKSGGRRGSGCLTCTGADAELTSQAVASGTLSVSGEATISAVQGVTMGLAINRQRPEAFDIDLLAGNEVAATIRVTELGTIECIGIDTVSLSNILPIGDWVYLNVTVTGDGGPLD